MNKNKIKQLIRHLIKVLHLSFFFNKYRMMRGQTIDHLFVKGRQNRFTKIYETKVWLEGRETGALSGPGSELENTENIRQYLPKMLTQFEVKSLLDIGCGDWTWMQHLELPCPYIGIDIVPSVIQQNNVRFSRPGVEFRVLDAISESIPDCDAILCREVIFHLSFSDSKKLLNNIKKNSARFILTTSDSTVSMNADIQTGDFRNLNLRLKPFNFPTPLMTISDNRISPGRNIELWRLSDLQEY